MTTANESWSIEISPKDAPDTVRHEHELIELDVNGTEWQSHLVDTAVDVLGRSDPSYFTVLVRREPRSVAKVSETLATISGSSADVPAGQDPNAVSGQNPLWEGENGRTGASLGVLSLLWVVVSVRLTVPYSPNSLPRIRLVSSSLTVWLFAFPWLRRWVGCPLWGWVNSPGRSGIT